MSGMDNVMSRLRMTGMTCLGLAPDGRRCRYRTNDEMAMDDHLSDHRRLDAYGHWWDNCQVCGNPIHLTKALVLRAHGGAERCAGSGNPGTFQRRCAGDA